MTDPFYAPGEQDGNIASGSDEAPMSVSDVNTPSPTYLDPVDAAFLDAVEFSVASGKEFTERQQAFMATMDGRNVQEQDRANRVFRMHDINQSGDVTQAHEAFDVFISNGSPDAFVAMHALVERGYVLSNEQRAALEEFESDLNRNSINALNFLQVHDSHVAAREEREKREVAEREERARLAREEQTRVVEEGPRVTEAPAGEPHQLAKPAVEDNKFEDVKNYIAGLERAAALGNPLTQKHLDAVERSKEQFGNTLVRRVLRLHAEAENEVKGDIQEVNESVSYLITQGDAKALNKVAERIARGYVPQAPYLETLKTICDNTTDAGIKAAAANALATRGVSSIIVEGDAEALNKVAEKIAQGYVLYDAQVERLIDRFTGSPDGSDIKAAARNALNAYENLVVTRINSSGAERVEVSEPAADVVEVTPPEVSEGDAQGWRIPGPDTPSNGNDRFLRGLKKAPDLSKSVAPPTGPPNLREDHGPGKGEPFLR